jgi:hypothetical protein
MVQAYRPARYDGVGCGNTALDGGMNSFSHVNGGQAGGIARKEYIFPSQINRFVPQKVGVSLGTPGMVIHKALL